MTEVSEHLLDIDERRRRAPLHFLAKADNARYAAYALWTLMDRGNAPNGPSIGYHGSPGIALQEAWVRERSLALECIIKAVMAQREECKPDPVVVPATHNVCQLWGMAGLPKVGKEDRLRLLRTWQALQWASRYAAPTRGSDGQRSEIEQHSIKRRIGKNLHIIEYLPFGWDEFDALYEKAARVFFEHRAKLFPEFVVEC